MRLHGAGHGNSRPEHLKWPKGFGDWSLEQLQQEPGPTVCGCGCKQSGCPCRLPRPLCAPAHSHCELLPSWFRGTPLKPPNPLTNNNNNKTGENRCRAHRGSLVCPQQAPSGGLCPPGSALGRQRGCCRPHAVGSLALCKPTAPQRPTLSIRLCFSLSRHRLNCLRGWIFHSRKTDALFLYYIILSVITHLWVAPHQLISFFSNIVPSFICKQANRSTAVTGRSRREVRKGENTELRKWVSAAQPRSRDSAARLAGPRLFLVPG